MVINGGLMVFHDGLMMLNGNLRWFTRKCNLAYLADYEKNTILNRKKLPIRSW